MKNVRQSRELGIKKRRQLKISQKKSLFIENMRFFRSTCIIEMQYEWQSN